MKLLLAIKGCRRDVLNGFHQAIRETWMKDVEGADAFFFVGGGTATDNQDEIGLACPDEYMGLPHKTKTILHWSLEHGYDFTFLCDTDTYVIPSRLLNSGFQHHDLTGLFNGAIGMPNATEGRYWAWISGGNGYWLSRRAARIVVEHQIGSEWAEDRMVGQALGSLFRDGSLQAHSHQGYGYYFDADYWRTDITSHYCTSGMRREFDPVWMRNKYAYNVLGGKGMVHGKVAI